MLHEALKLIRTYHKQTQRDLAKELDISVSYLSEIEAGNRRINLDIIEKYAATFGIPASSIMYCGESIKGGKVVRKPTGSILAKKMTKIMLWATGATPKRRSSSDESFW